MKRRSAYIFIILLISLSQLKAQNNNAPAHKEKKVKHSNFVKFNFTGILLKNYSLQYERVLGKAFSFAVAFRTMPNTILPVKNLVLDAVGNTDPDTKNTIEKFRLNSTAITPEIRLYVGKHGYGQGFYFAPFYRYVNFKTNSLSIDYEGSSGPKGSLDLTGKLTTTTGGLLLGAQWALGKHLCLDWWILGPHYGSAKGSFEGKSNKPLTQDEQNDLKESLEGLDIPLTDKTVNVNANGASLKLDGPWAGIRAGFSLGVRF